MTSYQALRFRPTAVLFDLDGTLLDTAPDMGWALNQLLCEQDRDQLPQSLIRPVVSHGSLGLLKLGFGIGPEHPDFDPLRQRYLKIYNTRLAVETILFPGIAEVLAYLEKSSIPWGIVTNKPGWLTEPLLQHMDLRHRAATVVSGDTTVRRKPDPDPLFYACTELKLAPELCLYVGDAERDILAGRRAGMATLVASYGYLHASEKPETWGADGVVDSADGILSWLQ